MRLSVLAFLCGILWVQQLPQLPSGNWALLFLPLMVAALRWPRAILPGLFLLAGVLWASWRAELILAESLPPALEGMDLQVEGRIADLPSPTERGVRFRFHVHQAWHAARPVQMPKRILLTRYRQGPPLRVGDAWRFTVRLKQPHGFQNPGGFDYEAHLLQQRIRATGYVRDDRSAQRLDDAHTSADVPVSIRLNRARQQLSERIQRLMDGHRFTALVTAFANGDDDAIPDDQWQVLSRTGTGHLVAISGMNIGLVAGLAYFLVRLLWAGLGRAALWIPAPRIASGAALLAALMYAALAGFAIPTQRALVMLIIVLAAMQSGRKLAASSVLALAMLAVLLVDPLSVLAAGFWLSFAAVAVIVLVVRTERGQGWPHRLLAWGRLQWAIAIGLLPLLLYLFQQTSVVGPFANLAAIPVIEIIVIPATLLGIAAEQFLPDVVAAFLLAVAAGAIEGLWPLLEALARLPVAIWAQHAPPIWALATSLVGVLLLLAPPGFPARWLGIVWLLPLLLARPPGPSAGEIWLTLLDVGQGLSAIIRTSSRVWVFDTGARFSARLDAGRAVIVPFLRYHGISRIDTLIVSHGDNDHIGGSASLLAEIPVSAIYSGVPSRIPGAQDCRAGQQWELEGVRFEILHPGDDPKLKGNNRSCVLRIAGPHGRILLPGDITVRAEHQLVRTHVDQLRADLLVVPHHGSKTSSSDIFLDTIAPRYALFPVGYRNRYRHPDPGVVRRYLERDIRLADSAESGAIEIRFTADGIHLTRYRVAHRRYWHRPERLSASPPV